MWDNRCALCPRKQGVCIQCASGKCAISFHPSCVAASDLKMHVKQLPDGQGYGLFAFCSKHKSWHMKIYIHIGCGIFTQDSFKYNHSIIINSMHTSTSTNSFQIDINLIINRDKLSTSRWGRLYVWAGWGLVIRLPQQTARVKLVYCQCISLSASSIVGTSRRRRQTDSNPSQTLLLREVSGQATITVNHQFQRPCFNYVYLSWHTYYIM